MCCGIKNAPCGVPLDAKLTLDAGEETEPKTKEQVREVNMVMPLLMNLCLAMRSDPLGVVRGLGEVVTYVYRPAVTYAFPDPLITAYRYSCELDQHSR